MKCMAQDISSYTEKEFEDITPYENYLLAIRNEETRRRYQGQLEMFLDPNYQEDISAQKRKPLDENQMATLVNDFVNMMKRDPNAGSNKLKRYVMKIKRQVDEKKLNSNTSKNRLKPIKKMLRANDIDLRMILTLN